MQVGRVFRKTPVTRNQRTSSETRSAARQNFRGGSPAARSSSRLPAEAPPGTETASAAAATPPTAQSSRNARSTWKERSMWRLLLPAVSADPAEAPGRPAALRGVPAKWISQGVKDTHERRAAHAASGWKSGNERALGALRKSPQLRLQFG